MVYKFERMQLHPDKIKTKGEKFPWRYNKEAFTWYKSADTHNIKRKIPLKVWMIPITALIAVGAIYGGIRLFNGVVNGVKDRGAIPGQSSTSSSLPGQPAAGGSAAGGSAARPVFTAAQYSASYKPRIEGFPQTAPRYDDVEKVTQAPKPAACIHGKKPGVKSVTCGCWSQQGTRLFVPEPLCVQIAAGGWFDDTLPLEKDRVPVAAALPAPVAASASASSLAAPAPVFVAAAQPEDIGYGLRSSRALAARNAAVGQPVSGQPLSSGQSSLQASQSALAAAAMQSAKSR